MKLVSACLAGCRCRYDQQPRTHAAVVTLLAKGEAVPVCPEQLGGLPTPRTPCEIVGGSGEDVLDGRARVVDSEGCDRTAAFIAGAEETLRLAHLIGVTEAILKENSPSCGTHLIYDGTFTGIRRAGQGVTAALLRRNGIRVDSEESLL